MSDSFTEEDAKRYVEALNFIVKEAKFGKGEPDLLYMINARNHFSFLQTTADKINSHILEVKKVTNQAEDKSKKKSKGN